MNMRHEEKQVVAKTDAPLLCNRLRLQYATARADASKEALKKETDERLAKLSRRQKLVADLLRDIEPVRNLENLAQEDRDDIEQWWNKLKTEEQGLKDMEET